MNFFGEKNEKIFWMGMFGWFFESGKPLIEGKIQDGQKNRETGNYFSMRRTLIRAIPFIAKGESSSNDEEDSSSSDRSDPPSIEEDDDTSSSSSSSSESASFSEDEPEAEHQSEKEGEGEAEEPAKLISRPATGWEVFALEVQETILNWCPEVTVMKMRGVSSHFRDLVTTLFPLSRLRCKQARLMAVLHSRVPVLLTGPGGCGKTSTLQLLLKRLIDLKVYRPDEIRIVCPTHQSRELMAPFEWESGVHVTTLHSFLCLNRTPSGAKLDEMLARFRNQNRTMHFPSRLRLLVIDEVSMVGERLFACVDRLLREYPPTHMDPTRRTLPFGGVQLLMSGDFGQLPPVGDRWAFLGDLWTQQLHPEVVELDFPLRQSSDLEWFEVLQSIRLGRERQIPHQLFDRMVTTEHLSQLFDEEAYYRTFIHRAREAGLCRFRGTEIQTPWSFFRWNVPASYFDAKGLLLPPLTPLTRRRGKSTNSSRSPGDFEKENDEEEETDETENEEEIDRESIDHSQMYSPNIRPHLDMFLEPWSTYHRSLLKGPLASSWPLELSSDNRKVEEMNTRILARNPFPVDQELVAKDQFFRKHLNQFGRPTRVILDDYRATPLDLAKLQAIWRFPRSLTLKVGARYLVTANLVPEWGLWNGATLIYVGGGMFMDRHGRRFHQLRLMSSVTLRLQNDIWVRRRQVALRLGYALTVHRSQGMTVDEAIVNASQIRTHGQLYVALSRVRTRNGVFLLNANPERRIPFDERVAEFYHQLSLIPVTPLPPCPLSLLPPSSTPANSSSFSMASLISVLLSSVSDPTDPESSNHDEEKADDDDEN